MILSLFLLVQDESGMEPKHDTAGVRIYTPTRRRDFLLAITIYQILLGIRYLNPSDVFVEGISVFDWLQVAQSWHLSVLLFASSAFNLLNILFDKWVRLAFMGTILVSCITTVVWFGALIDTGRTSILTTIGIHAVYTWFVWLAAGVVDTTRKKVIP